MYFEYKIHTDFQRFIYYLIVKLNEGCRERCRELFPTLFSTPHNYLNICLLSTSV
jgi:hypothetical protein